MNQADRLFEAAQRAFQAKRFAESEALCSEVSVLWPKHLGAKLLSSSLAGFRGDAGRSAFLLREALAIDPDCLQALLGLANFASAEGNVDEAISLCRRAMKLRPDLGSPHFHLGRCLLAGHRYAEAAVSLERAVAFDPKMPVLHYHLGLAYQQIGRGLDAAKAFKTVIDLDPKYSSAHSCLGMLLLANGNIEAAIGCFRRVAELEPGSARGAFYLGRALNEERDFKAAEACLRRALQLDPSFDEARVLLARVLQQGGEFVLANSLLDVAGDEVRSDAFSVMVSGRTLTEDDRLLVDKMQIRVDAQGMDQAERRTLYYALGKAYDDLGDYERAMKNYHLAAELSQARLCAAGRRFDPDRLHRDVDVILSRFDANFFMRAKHLGVASETPIFIVGMPRSGTTLLEQIVSSHREVSAAGELGGWPSMANGPFQNSPTLPTPSEVKALASEFLARLEAGGRNSRFITEKSPQNYMILGPILAAFPNAHVLHCRRHPLDTCLSIYTTPFMAGADFAHDRSALVSAYREYSRVMGHWKRVLPPNRLLDVDYEALVGDSVSEIQRILGFLGLEWDDACLRHEENEHAISTPSLWQARQPIYSRSVGRWRHYHRWLGPLLDLQTE